MGISTWGCGYKVGNRVTVFIHIVMANFMMESGLRTLLRELGNQWLMESIMRESTIRE
jgi:hypothetical protein